MELNPNTTHLDLMISKAKAFHKSNIPVHVKMINKEFRNGVILEICSDFFILEEELRGKIIMFYSELRDIVIKEPKRGVW